MRLGNVSSGIVDLRHAMRIDLLARFPGQEEMAAAVAVQGTERERYVKRILN